MNNKKNIFLLISNLKKERLEDLKNLENLIKKNINLENKLLILKNINFKINDLSFKIENILEKYLENEKIKNNQLILITKLKQEIILLKNK